MLTPFDAAAILIVLAAVFGYFNHRVLKLPSSIGLTMMEAAQLHAVTVTPLMRLFDRQQRRDPDHINSSPGVEPTAFC